MEGVEVPDRPPDRIEYGGLEPTGFGYMTWEDRPSFLVAMFGGHNWVPVTRERWARRRFEYWEGPAFSVSEESDGSLTFTRAPRETIGRSYLVPEPRYQPNGSPDLPQRCARDYLEDEMGYEVAVEHIGARECSFGFPLDRGDVA